MIPQGWFIDGFWGRVSFPPSIWVQDKIHMLCAAIQVCLQNGLLEKNPHYFQQRGLFGFHSHSIDVQACRVRTKIVNRPQCVGQCTGIAGQCRLGGPKSCIHSVSLKKLVLKLRCRIPPAAHLLPEIQALLFCVCTTTVLGNKQTLKDELVISHLEIPMDKSQARFRMLPAMKAQLSLSNFPPTGNNTIKE